MIKTIIFDLGNVIIPFNVQRAYERMAGLCGCGPEEVRARIRATGLVAPYERGEIETEPFIRALSEALRLEISYAQFCEWWSCVFLPETLVSEALLEDLARRRRLLVLSNTNPIHFAMVRERYALLRHFDDFVLSYEVKAAKPDARIYQEAVARAGCGAGECFFIDDLVVNVEAAREQGMDAVVFESQGKLEDELRARGLLL